MKPPNCTECGAIAELTTGEATADECAMIIEAISKQKGQT